MKSRILIVLAVLSGLASRLGAQEPFTQLPQNFVPVYLGSSVWADYDRDGHMDLYVTGWRSQGGSTSAPSSYLYRNNGDGTFSEVSTSVVPLGASAAAWGDFDNDGYPDLAVAGNTGASAYDARIYRNNGNGTFTDIQAGLAPLLTPALAWGDLNNDGLPDLIASGTAQDGSAFTGIYYNNGNNTFSLATASLPQLTQSAVAIADLNLDGLNDIIICGRLGTSNYISRLYLNQGNGSFIQAFSFEPARYPAIDIADVDGDGLPDVVIQGGNNTDVLHTSLYKNQGGGNFQLIPNPFTGVYQGWAAFGDYNNDGAPDLAITGSNVPTGATRITKLYSNNGSGIFSEVTAAGFPGLRRSMVQWGDMNNDGKLDLLITGYFNVSDYMTRVYVNNAPLANTPPLPPAGLTSNISGNEVQLTWLAASDAQTPVSSLTYNLRVGTSPGSGNVVAAHALPNGKLTIPRNGNQGHRLNKLLQNLPDGTYYWSVQAVDAGFMGSEFAQEQSFTIGSPAAHEVTFVVTHNGQAIAQALVETPAGNAFTNSLGHATLTLPAGNHAWFVNKSPFRQAFGFVQVNAPTQIEVSLQNEIPVNLPFTELFNIGQQPAGWHNQVENNNFARWHFNGTVAMAGTASAGPANPVHTHLTSPEVLTEGLIGNLKLSFSHRLTITGSGAKARVYVYRQTQSLPVWEQIAEYTQGTGGSGGFVNVDIPIPINAGASSVRLRFELEETQTSPGLWEIDQVELLYQPAGTHEVQIVAVRPAANLQAPWFMTGSFSPAATAKNIGLQPIENLSLEVRYNGAIVSQSAAVNLAPGQTNLLEATPAFNPPAAPGTYALDYRTVAPGLDLNSPNNQRTYQLILTDSTYAQDYGTTAAVVGFDTGLEAGHVFSVEGIRIASLVANSIGIHWSPSQASGSFGFAIYELAPASNSIQQLVYQSPAINISASDAGQYRIYPLSGAVILDFNTRYALLLQSNSTELQVMSDGQNVQGYHKKTGNELVQVATPQHGAPLLRLNVQLVGGIPSGKKETTVVYPNPTRDVVRLLNPGNDTRAMVYTADGRLVMQTLLIQDGAEINLSQLKPGLYLIRLSESGRTTIVERIP
ncbi:MAG: T9SS type A sorting domain-containing protein [Bacteroidetes bacterium]|nr:T9SS type A sorting domain-containing protein [Bacteroidota bacterium]